MSAPSLFRHPVFGDARTGPGGLGGVPLSMIDVVFLLLIFLLLGQFPVSEGLIAVQMGGPSAAPDPDTSHALWVQVEPAGEGRFRYQLNDQAAVGTLDELADLIHARLLGAENGPSRFSVAVGTGAGVPFEQVVDIWDRCRRMGVDRLTMPPVAQNR
ncbi:MAG: hypothetical protein BIFFINMI_04099 [Phycisphaerae bacterium]|nr:hypothetical protein [Phycisphaerae bacterium]